MESSNKLNTHFPPSPSHLFTPSSTLHPLRLNSPKVKEYQQLIQDDTNDPKIMQISSSMKDRSLSNFSHISKLKSEEQEGDINQVKTTENEFPELENFLQIRIRTDMEKVEELSDQYPALDLRRAMLRIKNAISELCRLLISSPFFQVLVILIIIFNTVILALEDPKTSRLPEPYYSIELFFVFFYTSEFILIAAANGLMMHSDSYFRDWWNILDFTIIVTAWLSAFAGSGFRLSALRSLRILRPLKSISSIKGMKALVLALMNSIKPLLSALFILFFFIFVFAIAAVQLWMGELRGRCMDLESGVISDDGFVCGAESCGLGEECVQGLNNPNYGVTHFDNIFVSLVTIFQIITLEGWTTIMIYTETGFSSFSIFFYMPLIFIAGNLIINFTMAIIAISFKDISTKIFEKDIQAEKSELVTEYIFQEIYRNTIKYDRNKFPERLNYKQSIDSNEKFLRNEDRNQKENENNEICINEPIIQKHIKFNKAILDIAKSSIIGDQFEVESQSYEYFYDEDDDIDFQSSMVIDVNSALIKSPTLKFRTTFNKQTTSNGISRLLEPKFSFYKDFKGQSNIETNHVLTDIQPDMETVHKNNQDYNKLRSVITIKNKTLNMLKKDPSRVKNTRLEIVENFELITESNLDILPPPEKPSIENAYEFAYRESGSRDPLLKFYRLQVKSNYEKYHEFKNKFALMQYFSLKQTRKLAFFSLKMQAKPYVYEKNQSFFTSDGDWSGLDVNPVDVQYNINYCKSCSYFCYRIWASGCWANVQKFLFPVKFFILHRFTNNLMLLAVLINTIVLAIDRYGISAHDAVILQSINLFFTYFFAAEMFLKVIVLGPIPFLRDFMNLFDSAVVVLSLVEIFILSGGTSAFTAFRAIRIFRIFRVLRVVRIFRYLKSITLIINSISKSISNISYLFLLLILFQIIFTLLGMQVFGGTFEFSEGLPRGNFDNFNWAFITTFQILSVENWNEILTSSLRCSIGPASCLLLIFWIILGNFILLNLFLAILLDSFNKNAEDPIEGGNERRLNSKIQKKIEDLEKYVDSESENIDLAKFKLKTTQLDYLECERSYFVFSKTSFVRVFFHGLSQNPLFENFLLMLIIMNSLKLVWDTYIIDESSNSIQAHISNGFDLAFTICFDIEFLVKSVAFGFVLSPDAYLRDNWNKLDFIIVIMSTIDIAITSIEIPVIKVFRVLRTLRPLKIIKHNISLKIVVLALLESIVGILNVMIVIVMVWLIFAILGVSLLAGKMHSCSNDLIDDMDICINSGFEWQGSSYNFDNVLQAMITLFIVMSQESWPNRMFEGVDARAVGLAPRRNYNPGLAYFYVIYLILANFFLVNLFTVIVFDKFNEAKRNESSLSTLLLSKEQVLWTEIQSLVLKAKPWSVKIKITSKIRQSFNKLCKNKTFDLVIMAFILINMISMAMAYHEASSSYNNALDIISLICTLVFISEAVIKIVGLGLHYFKSNWNRFDFVIALSSTVDIILTYSQSRSVPFLRQGPQLIRVLRVIRVTRLLRLVKSLETLEKLVTIMTYSLPAILNVLGLLLLIFFIYAVLGSFLFHHIGPGEGVDDYFNFKNFHYSMTILWRISTGEDYPSIMTDCVNQLDSYVYAIYFLTFVGIIDFVVLDLFITITLQYFEEFYMNPYNSVSLFTEDLKVFKAHWISETHDSNYKIDKDSLISLIGKLALDFKFLKSVDKVNVIKLIAAMNIESDNENKFYFNDVLYAVLRRKYSKKINKRQFKVNFTIMRMEDIKTKRELKKIRENYKKGKLLNKNPANISRRGSKKVKNEDNGVFYETFYLKTVFSNWKKYAVNSTEYNAEITPQLSEVEHPGENSVQSEDS